MAAAGITTCGEFHYFHHAASGSGSGSGENFELDLAVIEAAREANLRLVGEMHTTPTCLYPTQA
jgi:hypothetical protein